MYEVVYYINGGGTLVRSPPKSCCVLPVLSSYSDSRRESETGVGALSYGQLNFPIDLVPPPCHYCQFVLIFFEDTRYTCIFVLY